MQGDALIIEVEPGSVVAGMYLSKRGAKFRLEVIHAAIVGTELLLECRPCDECGFRRGNPVQPLRQPCVKVERKGGMRERGQIVLVKWHGMRLQAGKVVR